MLVAGPTENRSESSARGTRRRGLRVVLFVFAFGVVLFTIGFLRFVNSLARSEAVLEGRADAIVVLTGAAFRINDALALLAAGRGQRLLISGVNPSTRTVEISRLVPEHRHWFDCCVDLDYSALNTLGNAIESGRWARQKQFRSLNVVTSNYHMPRALAELAHQVPDVKLLPFPVISERVRVEDWWSNPSSARLLFFEYLKYIVALVRIRIDGIID